MITSELTSKLANQICDEVKKAQENKLDYSLIYNDPDYTEKKNEFILFIKPELTLKDNNIKLNDIVKHIFAKISEFNFDIDLIKVLPGKYLDEHNIMARHYGVINKISNDAKNAVSNQAKEKFRELNGIEYDKSEVYGGHEFIKKFPEFTALTLAMLWQNAHFQKLASGTYCGKIVFDDHPYFLVNAFHPRQLMHFNAPGRSIVVFSLSSDIDWADARNNFIGVTDPSKANKGSIRNDLLQLKDSLGIPVLNGAFNGVHLSAGPVEALNELMRFNSDYTSPSGLKKTEDFRIGKLLKQNFDEDKLKLILENEKAEKDGITVSSFDITEEKNTDDMVALLKPYY